MTYKIICYVGDKVNTEINEVEEVAQGNLFYALNLFDDYVLGYKGYPAEVRMIQLWVLDDVGAMLRLNVNGRERRCF